MEEIKHRKFIGIAFYIHLIAFGHLEIQMVVRLAARVELSSTIWTTKPFVLIEGELGSTHATQDHFFS